MTEFDLDESDKNASESTKTSVNNAQTTGSASRQTRRPVSGLSESEKEDEDNWIEEDPDGAAALSQLLSKSKSPNTQRRPSATSNGSSRTVKKSTKTSPKPSNELDNNSPAVKSVPRNHIRKGSVGQILPSSLKKKPLETQPQRVRRLTWHSDTTSPMTPVLPQIAPNSASTANDEGDVAAMFQSKRASVNSMVRMVAMMKIPHPLSSDTILEYQNLSDNEYVPPDRVTSNPKLFAEIVSNVKKDCDSFRIMSMDMSAKKKTQIEETCKLIRELQEHTLSNDFEEHVEATMSKIWKAVATLIDAERILLKHFAAVLILQVFQLDPSFFPTIKVSSSEQEALQKLSAAELRIQELENLVGNAANTTTAHVESSNITLSEVYRMKLELANANMSLKSLQHDTESKQATISSLKERLEKEESEGYSKDQQIADLSFQLEEVTNKLDTAVIGGGFSRAHRGLSAQSETSDAIHTDSNDSHSTTESMKAKLTALTTERDYLKSALEKAQRDNELLEAQRRGAQTPNPVSAITTDTIVSSNSSGKGLAPSPLFSERFKILQQKYDEQEVVIRDLRSKLASDTKNSAAKKKSKEDLSNVQSLIDEAVRKNSVALERKHKEALQSEQIQLINKYQEDMEKLQKTIADLEAQQNKSVRRSSAASTSDTVSALKERIEALETSEKELKKYEKRYVKQLDEKEVRIEELLANIKTLQEAGTKAGGDESELSQLKEEIKVTKQALLERENSIKQLQAEMKRLSSVKSNKSDKTQNAGVDDVRQLQKQLKEKERDLNLQIMENTALKKEIGVLERQIQDGKQSNSSQQLSERERNDYTEKMEELAFLRKVLVDLKMEHAKLLEELDDCMMHNRELEKQLKTLRDLAK